jgi:hypothetical protein
MTGDLCSLLLLIGETQGCTIPLPLTLVSGVYTTGMMVLKRRWSSGLGFLQFWFFPIPAILTWTITLLLIGLTLILIEHHSHQVSKNKEVTVEKTSR